MTGIAPEVNTQNTKDKSTLSKYTQFSFLCGKQTHLGENLDFIPANALRVRIIEALNTLPPHIINEYPDIDELKETLSSTGKNPEEAVFPENCVRVIYDREPIQADNRIPNRP